MIGKRKNKQTNNSNGIDKINKKSKPNQKVQKQQKEDDYDEISSDNISLQDERLANEEYEEEINIPSAYRDEETVDQKRLRLAQQILQSAKKQSKQKINDDFFQAEDKFGSDVEEGLQKEEEDSYVAVERDDEFDNVTKTLQENLLKKKNLIYNMYADSIKEKFESGSIKHIQLKGHKKAITCIQFHPNKKYIYSASKDCSIIKWDIEQQSKSFLSLGKDKDKQGHYDEILCMAINFDGKYMVTGGKDRMIKLWDLQQEKLIDTFKGHKDTIHGLRFGVNSNQFCSVACDRTFKLWDASERAFMDTLYGHKSEVIAVDACSADNFISGGYDKQAIYWKTEHSTQLIFQHHDYSIDSIKAITNDYFVTGSQDGQVCLWSTKKKKPISSVKNAHGEGKWITALGSTFNTDIVCSGSYDKKLQIYKLGLNQKKIEKIFELPCEGIVNDIQFSHDCSMMAYTQGEEHRLGRWITANKIKNTINLIMF